MAIRKSTTARRREVRRTLKDQPRPWLEWIRRSDVIWSVLLFAFFAALSSLTAIYGQERPRYRTEQVVTETIVARICFRAIDKAETESLRVRARETEPSFYNPNTPYFDMVRKRLDALMALALDEKIETAVEIEESLRTSLKLTDKTLNALRGFTETVEMTVEGKKVPLKRDPSDEWNANVETFMKGLESIVRLTPNRFTEETDYERMRAFAITISHPDLGEQQRPTGTLLSTEDDPRAFVESVSASAGRFGPHVAESVVRLVLQQDAQPTYIYDEEETKRRKQFSHDSVQDVIGEYNRHDVLVRAGEKLTEFDRQVIDEERAAYLASLGSTGRFFQRFGAVTAVVIVGLGLCLYLAAYKPRITKNPMRGFALVVLLLLCQGIAVFPTAINPLLLFCTAIFPVLLAATVLAIAYDQRFALAVSAILSLIVVLSLDLTVGFAIVLLVGSGIVVSLLGEVRTRSKLVQVGLWAGLAMAATTWIVGLSERPLELENIWKRIFYDSLLVLATGVGTGMFTQGILPLIERVFKVTTSMTLKDLNDASHPLLRHMAQEAPGTYAHSLRMADMGEAAAESIGAHGLMCRVGAMYHDIGKIHKPMYFVENQGGGPNRHDKLSPAMSLLIIVGHVKDGVEMAREYGLPSSLRHFIESHHGTTLVEYFYHAARQQHQVEGKEAPTEFEFRYPGPKPQTKEAAIIMICDAVESSVRTLVEPNPARIEQLVHQMAMKRLMDNQFDQSNLTLQELYKIEVAITKKVCAIYHGRIVYPKEPSESTESRSLATTAAS